LKEHKQVGCAVVVDVLDHSHLLVRRVVELLDEIYTVVEVAIRLSSCEGTIFVVLVNIRSAVEVGIDRHFGEPTLTIVRAPEVGPAVSIPILGTERAGA